MQSTQKPFTSRQSAYIEVLRNPDKYKGRCPFTYLNEELKVLFNYKGVIEDLLIISDEIMKGKNENRTNKQE